MRSIGLPAFPGNPVSHFYDEISHRKSPKMAKLVITVDIPDSSFNPEHYPDLENPSVEDMIEFDIQQVEMDGSISESELLDNYLESGGIAEFEVKA